MHSCTWIILISRFRIVLLVKHRGTECMYYICLFTNTLIIIINVLVDLVIDRQ